MPLENVTDAFESYAGFLTALSLGGDIPNSLSVPQFIANGFKTLLAIGSESGYEFEALKQVMNQAATAATQVVETKAEVKKEEAKVEAAEEEEEEEEDMDLGDLFG